MDDLVDLGRRHPDADLLADDEQGLGREQRDLPHELDLFGALDFDRHDVSRFSTVPARRHFTIRSPNLVAQYRRAHRVDLGLVVARDVEMQLRFLTRIAKGMYERDDRRADQARRVCA